MKIFTSIVVTILTVSISAAQQSSYWQQEADYTMSIDIDVENYQYQGEQKIVYTNNFPDTLDKSFVVKL